MKKIGVLLIVIIFLLGCSDTSNSSANDQNGLKWHTTVEKALAVAQKENKQVLVQFSGSDWCKWCIKLNDEVFHKPDFAAYAKDNLVLVNLDFPRSVPQSEEVKNYNRSVATKYGVRGFPTVLLMDKKGNVVRVTGYQPGGPKAYVEHIKEAYNTKG
ncbi:MAG: thioredoxin family protein [Bacteroidota bacterium]